MSRKSVENPDDFDPYHKWLGIPENKRPPTYYQLLGIAPTETDLDTIAAAADRQQSFVKQFLDGPLAGHASSILFQVEQARMILLDSDARAKYDHTLKVTQDRRRKTAFEGEPIPVAAAGSRTVGEETGLAGQFLGIFAIVGGGLALIYVLAVFVPWGKLKNEPVVVQVPPATVQPQNHQPPANPPASTAPAVQQPNAAEDDVQQPDAEQPDANSTDPLVSDAELLSFFKTVVASQRKCGDAIQRVATLLDNCAHNDGTEVATLEEALLAAGEAGELAQRELDAAAIPEEGIHLRKLVAATRDWIKVESQMMQTVVPDAIRVVQDTAPSRKERTEAIAALRQRAGTVESAANLALVETETAFFKDNRIPVPPQVAANLAQARMSVNSAGAPRGVVAQGQPASASGDDSGEPAALLGGIADALAEHFVPLFNGLDTTGWRMHPKQAGRWRVENGILISPAKEAGSLYSQRADFTDFHLRVEARIDNRGDSGIWFRSPYDPQVPAGSPARPSTFEAQINSNGTELIRTGSLFVGGRVPDPIRETSIGPGQWFTMEVIADNNHIVVKVDGRKTANFTDEQRRYCTGCIILQKSDATTVVEFRKIEILEK